MAFYKRLAFIISIFILYYSSTLLKTTKTKKHNERNYEVINTKDMKMKEKIFQFGFIDNDNTNNTEIINQTCSQYIQETRYELEYFCH